MKPWSSKKLEIAAWVTAGVVMLGSLGYYNFIDKPVEAQGVEVGDVCPDFSVKKITLEEGVFTASEDTFTLYENRGKVSVINFWATWCSGCILELPEFSEIAEKYEESVEVMAVVGASGTTADVIDWMNTDGWKKIDPSSEWTEFALTFARYYDESSDLYIELGGKGAWPMTVVIDQEGKIVHKANMPMSLAELESVLQPLINE